MNIAVVDPNEFYQRYLRLTLPLLEGIQHVHVVEGGEDTLPSLLKLRPDVLIFDPCSGNQVDLGLFGGVRANLPECHLIAYLDETQEQQHGETLYRMGVTNVISKASGTEYLRYILRQLIKQFQANAVTPESATPHEPMVLEHKGIRPVRTVRDPEEREQRQASDVEDDEPALEASGSLAALRFRLIRNQDSTTKAEQETKVAKNFQRIWAQRRRVGTSSGNRVHFTKE